VRYRLTLSSAVANSGGPDSTCLLFLFKALSQSPDVAGRDYKPEHILSLTVDHGLQSVSSAMADVAASTAACMDVEHVTARVPWSTPPFPEVPKSGIESIARLARYHVLLNHLRARDTHILALGHHADDQQETALMRYDRKERTSLSDLAPMLSLRRWGMGVGAEGGLGFSGIHGMDRWLIRPLLGVRKVCTLRLPCHSASDPLSTRRTGFLPHAKPTDLNTSPTRRTFSLT
jgi:tRNA(Ile)-lysidine synthase